MARTTFWEKKIFNETFLGLFLYEHTMVCSIDFFNFSWFNYLRFEPRGLEMSSYTIIPPRDTPEAIRRREAIFWGWAFVAMGLLIVVMAGMLVYVSITGSLLDGKEINLYERVGLAIFAFLFLVSGLCGCMGQGLDYLLREYGRDPLEGGTR